MWSYYGAKTNLVDLYPKPKHDKIIEPFAGTSRYALKYFDREVLLVDKYPVVVKIWKWLQSCSEQDVLGLPRLVRPGQTVNDFSFDCEGAKLLFSFLIGCGAERPRIKATDRKTRDRPNHVNYNLQRIAKNLFKIRHWQIMEGCYTEIGNQSATWFIDPPYEFGGQAYVKSSKHINFQQLAEWCKSRQGQVIVCENTKATWMDFKPMIQQRGSVATTTEAIWTNEISNYHYQQVKLIA